MNNSGFWKVAIANWLPSLSPAGWEMPEFIVKEDRIYAIGFNKNLWMHSNMNAQIISKTTPTTTTTTAGWAKLQVPFFSQKKLGIRG